MAIVVSKLETDGLRCLTLILWTSTLHRKYVYTKDLMCLQQMALQAKI